MNRTAQSISARLSLRPPQTRSLEILAGVADMFALRKDTEPAVALEAIRREFPSVESFERDFPSLCFALATGVGKTRLMGALWPTCIFKKAFVTSLCWRPISPSTTS